MEHKYKWVVPEKPAVFVPQRKNIVFLGTATRQVGELERKSNEGEDTIEAKTSVNCKGRRREGLEVCTQEYSGQTLQTLS